MRTVSILSPLSDFGGGFSIDDDFIRRKVDEFSDLFNPNSGLRDWSISDPIREGTAGILHRFDTSNMENERLQSLVGLDNNQFIDAVQSGRVTRDEWPLGKMPQQQRDTLLQAQIARRNQWQENVNKAADYVMPDPHAAPEGWAETAAYEALKIIPGALEATAELAIAQGIPFGTAALITKNVLEGSQNAQEQVYSNLRNQGNSIDEARKSAMGAAGNIADLVIRSVTTAATINALGQIPTATGLEHFSPIAQVAGNIAKGAAYSGAGSMGTSALTDIRSGNDIDLGNTAKQGAIAAGATGLLGAINAARQGKQLWDLQKQYYANKPITPEYTEYPDITQDNLPALNAGDNQIFQQDNTQPTPPPNTPNAPANDDAPSFSRYNDAVTKRGFEPVSGSHSIQDSFMEVQNAVQYGQISPQEVRNMISESGLSENVADGIIAYGIQARKNDLRNMYNMQVHNGMSKPQVDVISPLKSHRSWIDPMTLGHGNPPNIPDNPYRYNVDVLGGVPRPEVSILGEVTTPDVDVLNMDIPQFEVPEAHSLMTAIDYPSVNTIPLDDPRLAPPFNIPDFSAQSASMGSVPLSSMYVPMPTFPEPKPIKTDSDYHEDNHDYLEIDPYVEKPDDYYLKDFSEDNPYKEFREWAKNTDKKSIRFSNFFEKPYLTLRGNNPYELNFQAAFPDNPEEAKELLISSMQALETTIREDIYNEDLPYLTSDTVDEDYDVETALANEIRPGGILSNLWYQSEILDDTTAQRIVSLISNELTFDEDRYLNDIGYTKYFNAKSQRRATEQEPTQKNGAIIPSPPKPPFDPHSAPYKIKTQGGSAQLERPDTLGGVPNIQKPNVNGGLLEAIKKPDVHSGNIGQAQKPNVHSIDFPERPRVHKPDFLRKPSVHTIDLNDPRLAPPDYSKKNTAATEATDMEDDGYIGELNFEHFGKKYSLDVFADEFEDENTIQRFGKSFIELTDYDGNPVADYMPETDAFYLRPEFQTKGWARNIEDALHNQLPDLLRKAGLSPNKKDEQNNILTPLQALAPAKENKSKPQKNADNVNHTPLTALETIKGENNIAPFEVNVGQDTYQITPEDNGRFSVYKLQKINGTVVSMQSNSSFYNGSLHHLTTSGNDYKLSETEKQLEREIINHLQSQGITDAQENSGIEPTTNLTPLNALEPEKKNAVSVDESLPDELKKPVSNASNSDHTPQAATTPNHSLLNAIEQRTQNNVPATDTTAAEENKPEPVQDEQDEQKDTLSGNTPYIKLAHKVKDYIEQALDDDSNSQPISNKQLITWADDAFGGTLGEGKYSIKDIYDAMELGVNMYIKDEAHFTPGEDGIDTLDTLDSLIKLLELLPTQRNRTEEQNEFQQFSTPPTLAFIANWLANVFPQQNILEPSAGLGGLAVFSDATGADFVLNELSNRRAELLNSLGLDIINFDNISEYNGKVLRENAEHIGNILAPKIRHYNEKIREEYSDTDFDNPDSEYYGYSVDDFLLKIDRVIMNPPFSSTAGRISGQRDTRNAIRHIEQALQVLKPNGRLVAILGKGMAENEPRFRDWWKHIKRKYNVRANITLDGNNFRKYGTTFGNIIVVIDNNGATPKDGTFTRSYGAFQTTKDFIPLINDLADIQADIQDLDDVRKNIGDDTYSPEDYHIDPDDLPSWLNGDWENDEEDEESEQEDDNETKTPSTKTKAPVMDKQYLTAEQKKAVQSPNFKAWFGNSKIVDDNGMPLILDHQTGEKFSVFDTKHDGAGLYDYDTPFGVFMKKGFNDVIGASTPQPRKIHMPLFASIQNPLIVKDRNDLVERLRNFKPYVTARKKAIELEGKYQYAYGAFLEGDNSALGEYQRFEDEFETASKEAKQILTQWLIDNGHDGLILENDTGISGSNDQTTIYTVIALQPSQVKSAVRNSGDYSKDNPDIYDAKDDGNTKSSPYSKAQFKQAFDALDDGSNSVFIPDLAAKLKWPKVEISDMITALRQNGSVSVSNESSKNADDYNAHELYNLYNDENGFYYSHISWNNKPTPDNKPSLRNHQTNATASGGSSAQAAQGETETTQIKQENDEPQVTETPEKPKRGRLKKEEEPKSSVVSDTEAGSKSEVSISMKTDEEIQLEKQKERISNSQPKTQNDDEIPDTEELNIYDNYRPSRLKIEGAKHHPADLVESAAMASVSMPPPTYKPNLPAKVIQEGRLSEAQLEAVVYAGRAFQRHNTDGKRKGFFIGDGTGVGKGREISGIIMDNLRQGHGKGKAVWVSMNFGLAQDAKRDWKGLGNNPDDIFTQNSSKNGEKIKNDKGILFTAYSTISKKERLQQLKDWLGQDFDGVIVLDEAHNANNATDSKNSGRTKRASQRALSTMDLANTFPEARVLYVSATGATEVRNLAMLDRLGLWGLGTQFANKDDFINQISKGGTAAMELVARDLKAMGLYVARQLSQRAGPYGGMEDVTFSRLTHHLTPHQIAIYDKLTEAWQKILQNISVALSMCGADDPKNAGSAQMKFWSAHQKFFNQIITALQTPAIIEDTKKQLDKGNSVLIQLTNTNQADMERAIGRMGDDDTYDDLDITPKDTMINFLLSCFPTHELEEYEDDNGNIRTREVEDSNGEPVISDEAVRLRDELIADLDTIKFPESPLDMIINAFGAENVAEITGRTKRIVTGTDGKRIKESRSRAAREADKTAFNEGRKRILIFSEAGGTGASYHASKDFKNQQKRIHYLLQPGWKADTAVQGLGRSHRSNEAHKPHYVLVETDIPGQKRFLSTIARRLEQLGALTTGERKTTTNGIFGERDNLESSHVVDAMKHLFMDIIAGKFPDLGDPYGVFLQMGFNPEKINFSDANKMPKVTQFLNRILSMKFDMQKKLFAHFDDAIDEQISWAIQHGTIDMRTENVRADKITVLQDTVINHDNDMNADTNYVELELTKSRKPRKFEAVKRMGCDEFYITDKGVIVAARKAKRNQTDTQTGEIVPVYTLFTVDPKQRAETNLNVLQNKSRRQETHYTKLTEEQAQKEWQKQADELPTTYTEKRHMITGVLLPIWKKLTGSQRVQRVITEDGKTYLGRIIPPEDLKTTLARLNFYYKGENFTTAQVLSKLEKPGTVAVLSTNWRLQFSRVNGEKRLEVLNVDFYQREQLKDMGAFVEIINSQKRIFIPSGNKSILDNILKNAPVLSFQERNVLGEATEQINSEIPDDSADKLHFIHPFFRPDPDDNPYVSVSPYAFDEPETEKRYQESKKVKKDRLLDRVHKFMHEALKGFSGDFPELKGHKNLLYAQEQLRKLNRERKADVQETIKRMRAITYKLNNDDFDLFSRAMQMFDLHETINIDENAALPWGFSPESLNDAYSKIMKEVDRNPAVSDAIEKAEILGRELSDDLADAADELHLYSVRDKLKREHYFRHVVLEYFGQANGGAGATLRNPTRRGYLKHRKGSDKDISSDWITAMGEVWARMNSDIKILHTLQNLRSEYDIAEDLKQKAFQLNKDEALHQLMNALKDNYSDDEALREAANSQLNSILNRKQAQSVARLFKLARQGDLPEGDNNQWREIVYAMAMYGTLEQLPPKYRNDFTRYVGWLAGLEDKSRANATANRFIRSGLHKDSNLKKMLGGKFTTWQDLIPDDYDIWSPVDSKLIFSASSVPENVMMLAQQNIDELLGLPLSEIGNALAMGGDKQLWVIPKALANTLNDMGKSTPQGLLAKAARKAMSAFKSWVLFSPVGGRVIKYNWRNFFGDLEAVLQGNPEALMYVKQAFNELKKIYIDGGEATGLLAQFQKRGGALTSESREELLHNWEDLKEFANLLQDKNHVSPLKMPLEMFKGYMKMAGKLTEFREAILRYASFLAYAKMLEDNNGNPAFYGMSIPDEVNALDDIYDMAFKMANENLGAYDQLSQNTKWLRDNSWLSFISWVEVNFRRSIQMYKNIWSGNSFLEYWLRKHGSDFINCFGGGGNGNKPPKDNNGADWDDDDNNNFRKLFRSLGKSPVYIMRFAITLALAAPLMLILAIFNRLNGENDNKLTPDVKAQPHLTLNTNEFTGEVLYLNRLGSAFDFFETLGVDTLPRDLKELFDGRITFTELANRITDGPISKLINNFNPFAKAAIELLTGRKLYPDIEHPSNIRDNWEYVAQTLGLDWYYKMLTGKPHSPFLNMSSSVANTQKPEEASYWFIISRKKDFQEQVLGKVFDGFTQTKQGEALYNARSAAQFGDRKMMRKYLKEFYRAGGFDTGLEASVNSMNPLYGLDEFEQMQFLKWLPKDERKILRNAEKFYSRMKSSLLF